MSRRELTLIALALTGVAAAFYALDYAVTRDGPRLASTIIDLAAMLPLEVLVLSLMVSRVLSARERSERSHKMNMVIGVFLSDTGTPLLELVPGLLATPQAVLPHLAVDPSWDEPRLQQAIAYAAEASFELRVPDDAWLRLRDLLAAHRDLLIRLLENPLLLEHETFTDLLWAVFHLADELAARKSLTALSKADAHHLAGDAQRVYSHLLVQWLNYMLHLRRDYPFLFSFAARMNPLRTDAHAEVA